jgi:hypothetical protein
MWIFQEEEYMSDIVTLFINSERIDSGDACQIVRFDDSVNLRGGFPLFIFAQNNLINLYKKLPFLQKGGVG